MKLQRSLRLSNIALIGVFCLALGHSAMAKSNSDSSSPLAALKEGNARFISGKTRVSGQSMEDVRRLSKGQNPQSIVLSCSDSRVPPETVFDQKLGEVFTVRTAGQTLSPQAIGSMEYAVENLGSKLLVVLGHTSCGAVKAATETLNGTKLPSENLNQLVADIHPRLKTSGTGAPKNTPKSDDLKAESWANAEGVAKDLLARSKIIASAVESGRVKVAVGLYDLKTGVVEFR